jgi:hypothetical protein
MTLAFLNGSPRRKKSNSGILGEHFLSGYRSKNTQGSVLTGYLADTSKLAVNVGIFKKARKVIIIFPLYTDCMPGVVKEYFEQLLLAGISQPLSLGFIVQSGFPESIHSVYIERYLEKLTRRMGCRYLGTVIKGGVEGIQFMPESMTRKLYKLFYQLGAHFGEHDEFSPELVKKLKGSLRMSGIKQMGFRVFKLTGLPDFYWNSHLKKFGAYEKRYDRPYEKV